MINSWIKLSVTTKCPEENITARPDLKKYREMTLLLGELSWLPVETIDGHQIDDLHENSSFFKKLDTAIKTIKKHKNNILRFVDFFLMLPRTFKSSMLQYGIL
ncbi:MAG: hypothetical protein ACTSQS_17910 [Promethearchaeota archaeon]